MSPTGKGKLVPKRLQQQLYHPSSLPARIDLSTPDTLAQLRRASLDPKVPSNCFDTSTTVDKKEQPREPNRGGDKDMQLRSKGREQGRRLIQANLERYLSKLRRKDPTLDCSTEDVFVSWLRYFHKEYDDQWFSKNYRRLSHGPFREVFNAFHSIGGDCDIVDDNNKAVSSSSPKDLLLFEEMQGEQDSHFDPLTAMNGSSKGTSNSSESCNDILDLYKVRSSAEASASKPEVFPSTDACLIDL